MAKFGYKLMSEEHGPLALVENARRAEAAGFDFAAISDHYFPWIEEQGHSPFAWSVLGAIATATERIGLATAVTCPIARYHPAIVAQAAATLALLSRGRFVLGLGSGERLNEHVVGAPWPSAPDRQDALKEAVEVIQLLFRGGTHSYRGRHVRVEDARLFDLPDDPPPIAVAAAGPRAAELAGALGVGLVATESKHELVEVHEKAGGKGPRLCEIPICFAKTHEEGLETAHRYFRWAALGWKVQPELADTAAFAAASRSVRPEDLEEIAVGPDPEVFEEKARAAVEAGFDHLILTQIGKDQAGFCDFYRRELAQRLEQVAREASVLTPR